MRVYSIVLLTAFAVSIVLTPVVRRVALALNVVTPLRERDVHAYPVPRLGGLAMTGGIVVAMTLANSLPFLRPVYEASPTLWSVLAGVVAITILGAVDDVWELDWLAKLTGQVLITGGMALGGVQLINIPLFGVTIGSSRLSILLSVFILVSIINAVNFVDGLDGLAAGVMAIGSLGFFVYSYTLSTLMGAGSYATAASVVTVVLAGASLGFLWYNFHPASIFMGDSGAMVLGLMLGSATIIVTGQVNPAILSEQSAITPWVPLILPAAVLIIPLADLLITPLGRLVRGQSPVSADRSHLHHRLLGQGHSHRGVVLIMYGWTAFAGILAVSLIIHPAASVLLWAVPLFIALTIITAFQFPGRRSKRDEPGAGMPGGPKLRDDGQTIIGRPHMETTWRPLKQWALPLTIVDEAGRPLQPASSELRGRYQPRASNNQTAQDPVDAPLPGVSSSSSGADWPPSSQPTSDWPPAPPSSSSSSTRTEGNS